MKPCRDIETIERLKLHHRQMQYAHQERVEWHKERENILNEYLHEIGKPGFRIAKSYIKVGTTKRSDTFVTVAGDTHTNGREV